MAFTVTEHMYNKSLDPDFSELSDVQLERIDACCSDYEAKRTQGTVVSIESYLDSVPADIRPPLLTELLRVEIEILDSWDLLDSHADLVSRYPKYEDFIIQQWRALKTRTHNSPSQIEQVETKDARNASDSTHDEDRVGVQSVASHPHSSDPLDRIRRFEIVRNLAQGGIGTLFVAFDHDLGREVAIKELKKKYADVDAVVQRFQVEASITGNLEHPNIVPVYATGTRSDGRPYYAMRLIQGRSMQSAIATLHGESKPAFDFRKDESARDLLLRFITVCKAIGFAHSRGIIHRDIKPSNIMLGEFGETLIVDWGLARRLHALTSEQTTSIAARNPNRVQPDKTLHGAVVGTPGYMSPEQASGNVESISSLSDIYSLGATLFQILTNTIPLEQTGNRSFDSGDSLAAGKQSQIRSITEVHVESQLLRGESTLLGKLKHSPAPLAAICKKAMAHEASARYANAELLARDLEAWMIDEPVSVHKESQPQKLRRWARNHPAFVAGSLASLLITLVAMGLSLSILSRKNNDLYQANLREQASAKEAAKNASIAEMHAKDAMTQRKRVLEILNTFLVDIQRGLTNVPGSAAVQKNVLTTVLNRLGEVSTDLVEDDVSEETAMALMEMGDLFSRVGTQEIKLSLPRWNNLPISPLEAAEEMYNEAFVIATQTEFSKPDDKQLLLAAIERRQVELMRQTSRTKEAADLLEKSLEKSQLVLKNSPESFDAAIEVISGLDIRGQIYLQNEDLEKARKDFEESQSLLKRLSTKSPEDLDVRRRLGVSLSRLADVEVKLGHIDRAEPLYEEDLAIARALYKSNPENWTAKRDLSTSLDRIGNMAVKRSKLDKAMEAYLESRTLREELHSAEPTNLKSSQELFVSYMKTGDLRMQQKELDGATSDYSKAHQLAEEMVKADPSNAMSKRLQSISVEVLADLCIEREDFAKGLEYARESLRIAQEIADKDPADLRNQRDLVICHLKVAKVLSSMKDYTASLEQMRVGLKIAKDDYERKPDSLEAASTYSWVLLRIAEIELETGSYADTVTSCGSVNKILESPQIADRLDPLSRRRIVNSYTILGRALALQEKKEEAKTAFIRAKELANKMIADMVLADRIQEDLLEIDSHLKTLGETK